MRPLNSTVFGGTFTIDPSVTDYRNGWEGPNHKRKIEEALAPLQPHIDALPQAVDLKLISRQLYLNGNVHTFDEALFISKTVPDRPIGIPRHAGQNIESFIPAVVQAAEELSETLGLRFFCPPKG